MHLSFSDFLAYLKYPPLYKFESSFSFLFLSNHLTRVSFSSLEFVEGCSQWTLDSSLLWFFVVLLVSDYRGC